MKTAQRRLYTGSLSCEPDSSGEGGVKFELREVVELDQARGTEVFHIRPITVCARGELGARALDDLKLGDHVLISGSRHAREIASGLQMEAYEILSRAPQKKMLVPKVWAVAEGSPFEPTTL